MSKSQKKVRQAMEMDHTRTLLVRTARRVLSPEDSEDAAHDAVVQALVHADQFREDAQVSTWLHRIAFNAALVRQRSATRANRRLERAQRETGSAPGMASARPANVVNDLEVGELRLQLRTAVDRLPDVYRTVVERCIYQEQSPEVVARELGITASALRTRVMRARDRLRELLSHEEAREEKFLDRYLHAA